MKKIFWSFMILVMVSCSREKNPLSPAIESDFALYLLKDTSITVDQIEDKDIDELVLANQPLFSAEDMELYDYSLHLIYLKKPHQEYLGLQDEKDLKEANGRPFVVCASGKRCYFGCFYSALYPDLRLELPRCPIISDDLWYYASDIIHLENWWKVHDSRKNADVEQALKNAGIFRAGIAMELKGAQLISRDDTGITMQFSFEIKNNDRDALFLLDPQKVEEDKLPCFADGLLIGEDDEWISVVPPLRDCPQQFDQWNRNWFTKLESGCSMNRIILLKDVDFSAVKIGLYSCYFVYHSPSKIDREDRYQKDGRFWIGMLFSNDLQIQID